MSLISAHNVSMSRQLPNIRTLQQAVRYVIESNVEDGYPPNRFIQITEDGESSNLLAVCRRLINKAELLEILERALRQFPTLVVLEDFVKDKGHEWGFDATTIANAQARSIYFDQLVGKQRYKSAVE
jgi:hypothetical protein